MDDIYRLYKPLRNLLRQYDLKTGLITSYQYIQFLDFDQPLPKELRPKGLLTKTDRLKFGLVQWEFEILIRELILNSPMKGGKPLTSIANVARVINSIKKLENDKWGATEKHEDDVLYELVRIAHRQFPW